MVDPKSNEQWLKTLASPRFKSMAQKERQQRQTERFENVFKCRVCQQGKPGLEIGEQMGLTPKEWYQLAQLVIKDQNEGMETEWDDPRLAEIYRQLRDPYCSYECRNWERMRSRNRF